MKSLFIFLLSLILLPGILRASGEMPLTGTLPNGLTYYILRNERPAQCADFFLVQRAGSVFERDDQRGLAHFLEHMCFNGTDHFPANSLIGYLESKGVKFGANLNAYTGTDETVYNISKVPVLSETTVDSCLLILRDWSIGLTLDSIAIDAEREVIVNEWRHRSSPTNRMLEKALPAVYSGSPYGHRMPMGSMDIVRNFKPQALADFYSTWYHPGNQALIVVGDINPRRILKSIEDLLGSIPGGKQIIDSLPSVPDNEESLIEFLSDPEQAVNMVQLYFKHKKYPDALAADLATTMLADRFDAVELTDSCPHTYLGIGDVKFLLSSGMDALVFRGVVKPGKVDKALALWYTELVRALRHGFSEQEAAYAKARIRKDLKEKIRKAGVENNTALARSLTRAFLDREEYNPAALKAAEDIARLDSLTAEDAMAYLRFVADLTGRNNVILAYFPPDAEIPSEIDIRRSLKTIASRTPGPVTPIQIVRPLLPVLPEAGKIISSEPYLFPNTTLYRLSNGIRVITWPNDSVSDQIFIRGIGEGGLSMVYADSLAPTLRYINDIIGVSGFGEFSNLDLRRVLPDKDVKVVINIRNTEEIIEASTSRKDLEDAMMLLYLKATGLRPDTLSYSSWLAAESNKLRKAKEGPVQVMGDFIHRNVYNHHQLGLKETPEMLGRLNYAQALAVAKARFEDMSDFTFFITGDFYRDSLEMMLSRYLAPLPAAGRIERPQDIGYIFTPGNHDIRFSRKMETPVAIVYNFYHGAAPYELKNILAVNIFNQILKTRLLADLRENRGWTYSIQGHGALVNGMNAGYPPVMMMPVYIKTTPGHEQETADIVDNTIRGMLTGDITVEELDKARSYLAKTHREHQTDNAYRLSVLRMADRYGKDLHTGYLQTLDSLTPAEISELASPLLNNRTLLIMSPADR